MAKLFYARISKIDYEKGLADITIEEHEKQVINDVPFLAGAYEMPKIKERVAVLLEYSGKDFDKGIILGPMFSADKEPKETGKGLFVKYFSDGTKMKYDSNKGTFVNISADGAVPAAGTNAVTAQSLKLSVLGTQYTTNNADGTTQTSNFKDINVDFSTSTNVSNGSKSTLKVEKGTSVGKDTGKKNGAMIGLSVDQSGKIYASYDNGNTELLGQIAVAQFANASGLEKIGDNCYQTTLNSGEFDGVGVAVDADGSKINSGQLEMSNVDLSGQFTDMIITQRGFQANSRVITVSDTLLEELINLKR